MDTPNIHRSKPNQPQVQLWDKYWTLLLPSSSPSYWRNNLETPETYERSYTTRYLEYRFWKRVLKHCARWYKNREQARTGEKGANSIHVMLHDEIRSILKDWVVTYASIIVDHHHPQKENPNRLCITAGGANSWQELPIWQLQKCYGTVFSAW